MDDEYETFFSKAREGGDHSNWLNYVLNNIFLIVVLRKSKLGSFTTEPLNNPPTVPVQWRQQCAYPKDQPPVLLQVELYPRGTERTSGDRMKSVMLVR